MENERFREVRCFQSAGLRLIGSKNFLIHVLMAFLLSVSSPHLIQMLREIVGHMPPDILQSFKVGGVYNVGVLSVHSLDVFDGPFADDVLRGILSGSFIQYMIGMTVSIFLCSEYRNGYITMAIMRGQERRKLYFKYIGLSAMSVLPLIITYLTGASVVLSVRGHLQLEHAGNICCLLMVQIMMLLGLSVCVAASVLMILEYRAVLMVCGTIFVVPLLPRYIYILAGKNLHMEQYFLLSELINSAERSSVNSLHYIVLAILTAVIFAGAGLVRFCFRDYK